MSMLCRFISAVMLTWALLSHAGESGYYQLLVSLIDTNNLSPRGVESSALLDTNNVLPKATNTLARLPELQKRGEVFGVCLGQSVDDVVAHWGKPRWIWSRCYGGPRLCYANASVVLEPSTNRVMAILLEDVFWTQAARWTTNDCIRQLGEPESRTAHSLFYRIPGGAMLVGFWDEEIDSVRLDSRYPKGDHAR